MSETIGLGGLPQFEDRLLFHLVDITGDRPMSVGEGISEAELAIRLAGELDIDPDFPKTGGFHSSPAQQGAAPRQPACCSRARRLHGPPHASAPLLGPRRSM